MSGNSSHVLRLAELLGHGYQIRAGERYAVGWKTDYATGRTVRGHATATAQELAEARLLAEQLDDEATP